MGFYHPCNIVKQRVIISKLNIVADEHDVHRHPHTYPSPPTQTPSHTHTHTPTHKHIILCM